MIKQVLTVSLFVFLFITFTLYLLQRHLIYYPAKEMPSRQLFHAEDMQQLTLQTADGMSLYGWYKPAAPNQPTLLYLHGNAGHIGFRMPWVRPFLSAGFGVFLLEYRGFGGNKGKPTEQGLYSDGRSAIHYLQKQGIRPDHLAIYGESLGTGVATKLASEYPICALVLQSPFTSLPAVARYHFPWALIEPWDKYDSLGRISSINVPLLILHGKKDTLVPFVQGLTLFNQANEPKRLIALENKGHNEMWDLNYFNEIRDFIRSHCPQF